MNVRNALRSLFPASPSAVVPWFPLLAVLIAATLLRGIHLDGSLWLDEAAQALESSRPWAQQLEIAADFQPPLFHLWLWFWASVNHAEWWLRLASLIPGVASIWCVWSAVRLRHNTTLAWQAAALVGFSSLHGFFSQELRPYMLAVFWATLSWWAMETLLAKPSWWWPRVVLPIVFLGGVLSSYVYVFWCVGVWLATLLWQPRLRIRVTVSLAWAAGSFLIWWPWFIEQWRVGQTLRSVLPGWENVVSAPAAKAMLLVVSKFLVGILEIDVTWPYLLLIGGWYALFGLAVMLEARRNSTVRWWGSIVMISLAVAWLATWFTPVLAPKRVLFLLPILLALLPVLSHSRQRLVRWLGSLAIVWFVLVQIWAWGEFTVAAPEYREDWRGLTQEITAEFSPSRTVVIFAFDGPFAPWEWYLGQRYITISTGLEPIRDQRTVEAQLSALSAQVETVLVFDYLRDLTDPYGLIDEAVKAYGYTERAVLERPLIGQVHVYRRAELFADQNQRNVHHE